MGKILCNSCNKSCKGQTIKLQEKYFHIQCFKCKECQKLLATGSFYTKDNYQYCVEDYQKLFGVTCKVCGKFVQGEVVKALDNTYHDGCFLCSRCRKKFEPGDKVTYTEGKYLCNECLLNTGLHEKEAVVRSSGDQEVDDAPVLAPFSKLSASAPTTPARLDKPIVEGGLTSGSDADYLSDVKEQTASAKNTLASTRASTLNTSGYKSDVSTPPRLLRASPKPG